MHEGVKFVGVLLGLGIPRSEAYGCLFGEGRDGDVDVEADGGGIDAGGERVK